MVKMHSLGETPKEAGMVAESPSSEKKTWYPGITLSAEQLPDVKRLGMGDTGTMIIRYKVRSISSRENDRKNTYDVGFDLTSAGLQNNKKSDRQKFTQEIIKTMRRE